MPQDQLFVPFCARELPALSMPLRFCHRLQGDSRDEITFATLSAQRNGQELLLSLSFSCSQAELPEGVVLTRDGGENLEGIFWGARVSVPLLLLGPLEGLPISVRYQRGKVVSSPFPNGVGVIISHGEAPCSC